VTIPDHFQPLESSPFADLVGPLYLKPTDAGPVVAVRVGAEHGNRAGRAHGGLLMTLADIAVSRAARASLPPGATFSTASLQIAFLEGVGEGQWLEAVPRIDRLGRSLIHTSCEIRSGGQLVARVLAMVSVRLAAPD
jgi:acyl-coenzyme A thioesterase 13